MRGKEKERLNPSSNGLISMQTGEAHLAEAVNYLWLKISVSQCIHLDPVCLSDAPVHTFDDKSL